MTLDTIDVDTEAYSDEDKIQDKSKRSRRNLFDILKKGVKLLKNTENNISYDSSPKNMKKNFSSFKKAVYEFIYQLSSAIDGILDIGIRTAGAAQLRAT